MDFGLGLILSFTDNASGGLQNAVNTLNQLTETASNATNSLTGMAQLGAFSVVADRMGSSFMRMGSGMISTLGGIIGKVNETGQTLMYAESQLGKLYEGSDKTGKDVLNNISEYAKRSIFDFENLIPVVTMLKANGIEAFDEITSSTGKSRQMLMDYAADLAAFNPQMRNAYGTGIQAAMGALNEYIAEGNAVSLKRGASLDIESLLGEDKGSTIEERSQQVADLMEKLNMVGMTAQLAESPMTKISNMGDTLFQFLGMISNSGVYDKFNDIITVFADFVNNIPDEDLQAIADSIGSALSSLLKPVEWLAKKLVVLADAFKNLVANNPAIAKFVIIGTAIVGVLLLISGIALKVASSIGMLTIGLTQFSGAFHAVAGLLKAGAMKVVGALLPMTLAIGLMYMTWKNDLGGVRTLLTNFVADLRNSFSTAREACSMNVNGMMGVVNQLQNKGDFWSNFTVGLIKVGTLWKALCDAWNDYTLSEDLFLKCKELGILPLVEAILDLKWRLEHFWAGFKEGFGTALGHVKDFFVGLAQSAKGTIFEDLINKATEFFQLLTNNDPQAWKDLGNIVGQVAGYLTTALIALKAFDIGVGVVMKIVGVFMKLGTAVSGIGKIFGFIGKAITKLFPHITKLVGFFGKIWEVIQLVAGGAGTLHEALVAVFGPVATTLAGIGSIIAGVWTAVTNFVDMFINGFSWIKEILMVVGIALTAVGAIILGAPALVAGIVAVVVAAVASLIIVIKDHWTQICDFFSNLVTAIKDFFVGLWEGIKSIFSAVGEWFMSHVVTPVINAFNAAKSALQPIFDAIGNLVSALGYLFETVWTAIKIIVGNVMDWIGEKISAVWNAIVSFLSPILEGIKSAISTAWESIKSAVSTAMDAINSVITSIWNAIVGFISPIMESIKSTITSVWNSIVEGVSTFVGNIYNKIVEGFNKAIDWIKGLAGQAVQWGKDFIQGLIDGIASMINSVADAVRGVADKIRSFLHFSVPDEGPLTDYESWMPDFMQGLAEGINSSSEVVTSAITNFTNQVKQSLNNDVMASFQQFSTQWTQQMQVIITSTQQMSTGVGTGMKTLVTSAQQVGTGYQTVFKTILTVTQTTTTQVTTSFTKMGTVYTKTVTQMVTITTTSYTQMATITNTTFTQMATTVTTTMQKAVQAVQTAVNSMKSAMNFSWSLPHLKVPHVNISGSFNLDPPTAPKFNVNWYAKGGVFDQPSLIGVGEAGKEAVMPLENNTGWINDLAFMISKQIMSVEDRQFTPMDSSVTNNNQSSTSEDRYMTSNITNNNNAVGDTDNSITFAEGAIQINCQNASEEEAMRMAKVIMEYIKRQQQLDKMLAYG